MEIRNETHSRRIIMEHDCGITIFEVYQDNPPDSRQIAKRFYVVAYDQNKGQVYSILPSDNPGNGRGRWMAQSSVFGITYVASSRSLAAAKTAYYRYLKKEV